MGFKPRPLADRLARALIAPAKLERLLEDEVVLRIWGWDGAAVYRSRKLASERLAAEADGWLEPRVEVIRETADNERVAVELRIIAGPGASRLAHNRCAIITPRASRIAGLEMYCGEPVPYGPPAEHIAPATMADDEISRLLAAQTNGDIRRTVFRGRHSTKSRRVMQSGGEQPDALMNAVWNARWSADEADALIAATIEWHTSRRRGFLWNVRKLDEPADLAARLEAHGLRLVGEATIMAARIPEIPAIPENPDVELRPIIDDDPDQQEIALQIVAQAFGFDDTRVAAMRMWWHERLQTRGNPFLRVHYLAYVDGAAVGFGSLSLCAGTAQLTGAAVIAEARRRGVYMTMLSRRLADAADRGYEIASLEAVEGSRRVVERYGFHEFNTTKRYEWPAPG